MNLKSTLVAALSLVAFAGAASAVPITATTAIPTWVSTAGGVAVDENVSYGRLPDGVADGFNQVRWGTPANPSFATRGKSGLGFRTAAPVTGIVLENPFSVGTLRHYNWTIAPGTNATGSQLDISTTLDVGGSAQGPYTFSSKFTVDETLNVAPCAYPSDRPCSDKITFSNVAGGDTFTIGGIVYTLSVLGFGDTPTSLQDSFISQEGGTTDTQLWAVITAVNPPTPTPEPAPLALLALGLVGMGWVARRKI